MSRFGVGIALVLLLALLSFASIVHVTGPGWSGLSAKDSGPIGGRALPPAPGALPVPVPGVARTALTDTWADPRGGGTRTHHAIDIMAPMGAPVIAVSEGVIEKLFDSKLGGHTIYERSADGGTVYYYAHLDHYAPTLVEGQVVKAGQVIAAVGSTGDADPAAPHLHFEVHSMAPGEAWWQGREVDPYPLLTGK